MANKKSSDEIPVSNKKPVEEKNPGRNPNITTKKDDSVFVGKGVPIYAGCTPIKNTKAQ